MAYYDVDELIRIQMELQEKELVFHDILSYSDIIHFTYYPSQHRYKAEILPARLSKLPKAMRRFTEQGVLRKQGLVYTVRDREALETLCREMKPLDSGL